MSVRWNRVKRGGSNYDSLNLPPASEGCLRWVTGALLGVVRGLAGDLSGPPALSPALGGGRVLAGDLSGPPARSLALVLGWVLTGDLSGPPARPPFLGPA